MTKTELANTIAEKCDITKRLAESMIDALVETIENAVVRGNKVTIAGFGTFEVSERKARKGRNPQTGEVITIPAHRTPSFRVGKRFKQAVNGNRG